MARARPPRRSPGLGDDQPAGVPKRIKELGFPRTDRDRKFCERWLVHFDHTRAYLEAGFARNDRPGKLSTNTSSRALQKLQSFMLYLEPLRIAKARAVAERVTLNQADILDSLARVSRFNPHDYLETSSSPRTETVKGPDGAESERPVTWNGKPVYETRLRPISELTPEQASIVQLVLGSEGTVLGYRLPTIRERHESLVALGKQMGLFLDKIILQAHRHTHEHRHLHLEHVPTEKIRELTRELLPLVGRQFASELGFTDAEIAELGVATDQGAEGEPD